MAQRQAKKEQQIIDRQLKVEAKQANKKLRKAPIRKLSPKKVEVEPKCVNNNTKGGILI